MSEDIPRSLLTRTLRPQWVDLGPMVLAENTAGDGIDHPTAKLWSLVLASRHIPCRMRTLQPAEGGGHTVQVPPWFADRATEEILLYMDENKPDGRGLYLPDLRPVGGLEPTVAGMACLVVFFWLYSRTYPAFKLYPSRWLEVGSSEAWEILRGEWWRIFTGLTLHANGAHVMSNALIGGVFIWLAARRLGSGPAWLLTILGGGLGNLINALALGAPHDSIGFSTASFAAAGLLSGIACFHTTPKNVSGVPLARRATRFFASAMLPVAAGLGLLAMLGAGEETDLSAHLFGFLSGLGLGLGAGWLELRAGSPGNTTDGLMFAAAILIPVASWCVAWLA